VSDTAKWRVRCADMGCRTLYTTTAEAFRHQTNKCPVCGSRKAQDTGERV
jgi:rRNA maturation endonuclease Nob1